MTNPEERMDPWKEALSCFKDFADDVVIVGENWPYEFKWDQIGKVFQEGFEKSNGDESTYSWKNNSVSLTNNFIPSVGRENIIIGQAVGSNVGYESTLLKGENGVFKYRVLNKSVNSVSNFSAAEVASQVNLLRSRVQSQLLESLVDASDIQDNRGRFF